MATIIAGMGIGYCIGWLLVNGIYSLMGQNKNSINKLRETQDTERYANDAETDAFIKHIENEIRNYKVV